MIKKLALKNIRVFDQTEKEFFLQSLSLFCGTNNSGKSTILKSLLLLRQSQGIGESSAQVSGKLRFVGSQVDLGDYASFIHKHDVVQDAHISITIEDTIPYGMYTFLHSLKHNVDDEPKTNGKKLIPYLLKTHFIFTGFCESQRSSGRLSTSSTEEDELIQNIGTDNDDREIASPILQGVLKSTQYEIVIDDETLLSWNVKVSPEEFENGKLQYNIFIPKHYVEKVGGAFETMDLDLDSNNEFLKIGISLEGLLPARMISRLRLKTLDDDSQNKERFGVFPLPSHIQGALQDLHLALRKIHYLGPLRTPAERYYVTNLDNNPYLDPRGDFIPYILRDPNREPKVWNVWPGQKTPQLENLSDALNVWLYYLRTGEYPDQNKQYKEIEISTLKGVLVELGLKTSLGTGLYSLIDSGFGYSQLLPILIRGLLASKDSSLIIEQPELHLNPAIQVRIANFLAAMATAGKQVIVETHSEHIVNSIRVLAAEDESGELSQISSIFYVDVKSQSGQIELHELSIKPDGTVPKWPRQFFGEAASLTGRLLKAQKRFRTYK